MNNHGTLHAQICCCGRPQSYDGGLTPTRPEMCFMVYFIVTVLQNNQERYFHINTSNVM